MTLVKASHMAAPVAADRSVTACAGLRMPPTHAAFSAARSSFLGGGLAARILTAIDTPSGSVGRTAGQEGVVCGGPTVEDAIASAMILPISGG